MEYLVLALSSELRAHAACFLDQGEVDEMLEKLDQAYPNLVEVLRERTLPEIVTQILRKLLAEEITIRNLRQILQAMIDLDVDGEIHTLFDVQQGKCHIPDEKWLHDPDNVTTLIRIATNQFISHKYTRDGYALVVYLLDREIETLLDNPQTKPITEYLKQIKLQVIERILTAVRTEIGDLPSTAQNPTILTSSNVRPIFRNLIAQEFPRIAVVSYQELSADKNIQPMGRISLS
jgi:type III secretion protein V